MILPYNEGGAPWRVHVGVPIRVVLSIPEEVTTVTEKK